MKIFKKIILLSATVITFNCCAFTCHSQNNGDVIGKVYNTDIITLLDNVAIPSYNLNGTTVISLNDLEAYGFAVSYDDSKREIDVTTMGKPIDYYTPEVTRGNVGGIHGNVLYTDIKAYVNGILCPSYNVDGWTCVMVEELGAINDAYNEEFGYSDYNFNCDYDDSIRTLYLNSYRHPFNTYMDALNENSKFSANNELELYTTGNSSPLYFGAKGEPKSGIYAGINADGTDGFTNTFGVYSTYFEFDKRINDFFSPNREIIADKDNVNLIPWNIYDISEAFNNDDYIRTTCDNISKNNKTAIIRFASEMNTNSLGDSPSLYIKAFRHVADIIHEYDNLATMWAPADYGSFLRGYDEYYPGDQYVDWIGTSCFMKHDFLTNTNGNKQDNIVFNCGDYAWVSNSLKKLEDFMHRNNIQKPIAISEASVESKVHYADIDLNGWSQPRIKAMYWYTAMKFPEVKILTYFNVNAGGEVMDYKTTEEYRTIIADSIKDAGYLTTASQTPSISFIKAENKTYTSNMPIYIYAYFPEASINKVTYSIDNKEVASASDIPYKADINLTSLSNDTHTLTVNAVSDTQTYSYNYKLTYNNGWHISNE